MTPFTLLHAHPRHRARQLRWVIPLVALLLIATLATLAVQYLVSGREVEVEFFRAHKTISHTGQLLWRGMLAGGGALVALSLAAAAWGLGMSRRIVRPVHTLHRALEALAEGDLGVRVELHRHDEFQEVGQAVNRLADEFGGTLGEVRRLADRVVALVEQGAAGPPDERQRAQLRTLLADLDRALGFFRLAPRRVIREERS